MYALHPGWVGVVSPRVAYLGLGVLVLGVVGMLLLFDPRNSGVYPTCPFLGLTGCYCPGCGTLRALSRLLVGDVTGAMGYNPLAVLSLPFIAYSIVTGALRAFELPSPRPAFIDARWIWALLVGIILFWVFRNVPFEPFTLLAP